MAVIDFLNNFRLQDSVPLDTRNVVDNITARDGIPAGVRYEGLPVYIKDTDEVYYYTGADGTADNTAWQMLGGGGGSSAQLTNLNNGQPIFIWIGVLSEYNAIDTPSNAVMYVITDEFVDGPSTGSTGGSTTIGSRVLSNTNASLGVDLVNIFAPGTSGLMTSLPAMPSQGDTVFISNLSGMTDNVIGRNGSIIMGDSEDLNLDDDTASFRLTFTNTAYGWLILGAN